MAPLEHYLILSAVLFSLGVVGVVVRRNAIVVILCIELMMNGANLRSWPMAGTSIRWRAR